MLNTDLSLYAAHKTPQISQKTKNLQILRQKADEFEALLIKDLLDLSLSDKQDPLFGKAVGGEIYRSMYHDALSKELSGGFGYADLLYGFLKKNL